MQYRTKIAATFKKEFKRLYKRYPSLEQDVKNLREEILANPTTIGTDLGGAVYVKYVCALLPKAKAKVEGQGLLHLRL